MDFTLALTGQEIDLILALLAEQPVKVAGPLHGKINAQAAQQMKMAEESAIMEKVAAMCTANEKAEQPGATEANKED